MRALKVFLCACLIAGWFFLWNHRTIIEYLRGSNEQQETATGGLHHHDR
jgi:hypothetical protein